MSPYIKFVCLIGSMMTVMLPVGLSAQERSREETLMEDIERLGKRAVRDRVISQDEHEDIVGFVRDSLPEGRNLKIRALEQIRDELDGQYAEKIRESQKLLDEAEFMGREMLPGSLHAPEGFVSPEEKRRAAEFSAAANAAIDKEEMLKHVKPLNMPKWLLATLRLLFGGSISQKPSRWDYTVVPQMGGLYNITIPGGKPDDSWRNAPEMEYDPHPDKHFRR